MTETKPISPVDQLADWLQNAHDHRQQLYATHRQMTETFNHLLMQEPSDANLSTLIESRDKLQELKPRLQITTQGGEDWFDVAIWRIGHRIEEFRLAGAFSWRQPAVLSTSLMEHTNLVNGFTAAEIEEVGDLPIVGLDKLSQLPHPLCRLAEYLQRELPADVLENVGKVILPACCKLPGVNQSAMVQLVEFHQVATLMKKDDAFIRAIRAKAEQERQQHSFDPESAGISRGRWEAYTPDERDRIISEHKAIQSK